MTPVSGSSSCRVSAMLFPYWGDVGNGCRQYSTVCWRGNAMGIDGCRPTQKSSARSSLDACPSPPAQRTTMPVSLACFGRIICTTRAVVDKYLPNANCCTAWQTAPIIGYLLNIFSRVEGRARQSTPSGHRIGLHRRRIDRPQPGSRPAPPRLCARENSAPHPASARPRTALHSRSAPR
jgi:hypothetical protein